VLLLKAHVKPDLESQINPNFTGKEVVSVLKEGANYLF
jgi:hypothetical protein